MFVNLGQKITFVISDGESADVVILKVASGRNCNRKKELTLFS